MPSSLDRYEPNRTGIKAILKSKGVDEVLLAKARRVKDIAEAQNVIMESDHPGDPGVPLSYVIYNTPTINRSRVRVVADHPGGINAERKNHMLALALRAAKG